MRIAICLLGALLAAAFSGVSQQKKASEADLQAFRNARKISDPQAKIDALRRFVAQYPKSSRAGTAKSLLLETLVKHFPAQTREIDRQVNAVLKHAHGEFRMYDYDDVANTLADGNVLLPRAERISQKSLKMLREKAYSAAMRKEYIEAKMKPPADADLHRKFLAARSGFESTLGRIDIKQGKTAEGQPLLQSAYADNPDNSVAAAELGSLAAKDGKNEEAFTYLTRARLTGKLDDSQQKLLEHLYTAKQGGSMAGFEAYLDERYKALFPNPLAVVKYNATGNTSNRTVLEELFTGSGCDPCAGADLAVDAELERYSRKELVLLAFDQHIPEPDPLANPDSVKRFTFYQGTGTPTLALDGTTKIIGADRNGAKERFEEINKLVEKDLQLPPDAQITLTARRSGGLVLVHAAAVRFKGDSKDLKLQIALVEDELRYSGENGIRFHPMVVRSMARDGEGFALEPGTGCKAEYKFDIPQISDELKKYLDGYEKANDRFGPVTFIKEMYKINPADLSVVAFVQDMKTKTVLQAVYVRVADSQ